MEAKRNISNNVEIDLKTRASTKPVFRVTAAVTRLERQTHKSPWLIVSHFKTTPILTYLRATPGLFLLTKLYLSLVLMFIGKNTTN